MTETAAAASVQSDEATAARDRGDVLPPGDSEAKRRNLAR